MEKVVNKIRLKQQKSDFSYWQTQSPQKRLQALEEIRTSFHQYKYNAQPRLSLSYTVVKR